MQITNKDVPWHNWRRVGFAAIEARAAAMARFIAAARRKRERFVSSTKAIRQARSVNQVLGDEAHDAVCFLNAASAGHHMRAEDGVPG